MSIKQEADWIGWALETQDIEYDSGCVETLVRESFQRKAWLHDQLLGDSTFIERPIEPTDADIRNIADGYWLTDVFDHITPRELLTGYVERDGNTYKVGKYLREVAGIDPVRSPLPRLRDALSSLCQTTVRFSLSPFDILTASEFANFTSCHGFEGEHGAGPISYVRDAFTAIVYAYNRTRAGVPVKAWRAMVHFVPTQSPSWLGIAVMGREYANKNSLLRHAASALIMENVCYVLGDMPDEWRISTGGEDLVSKKSSPAYLEPRFVLKSVNRMGACDVALVSPPRCLLCGEVDHFDTLNGCCDLSFRCNHCEARCDEDDGFETDDDGLVCVDCFEEAYVHCQKAACDVVRRWTNPRMSEDAYGDMWCNRCFDECVTTCDHCLRDYPKGVVVRTDDGFDLCNSCDMDHAVGCEGCGKLVYEEVVFVTGKAFCGNCSERWRSCTCGKVVLSESFCQDCCGMEAMV